MTLMLLAVGLSGCIESPENNNSIESLIEEFEFISHTGYLHNAIPLRSMNVMIEISNWGEGQHSTYKDWEFVKMTCVVYGNNHYAGGGTWYAPEGGGSATLSEKRNDEKPKMSVGEIIDALYDFYNYEEWQLNIDRELQDAIINKSPIEWRVNGKLYFDINNKEYEVDFDNLISYQNWET